MIRDTFDMFQEPERGRFGDNESAAERPTRAARSNLCDLDLVLHNDNPDKKAIAVSLDKKTPFERWAWLARSLIEYERIGIGKDGTAMVRVTLPESLAKEKGLI